MYSPLDRIGLMIIGIGAWVVAGGYLRGEDQSSTNGLGPSVPNWVPIYPGTAPEHTEATKSGDEYHLTFSFTSGDDPTKVYSWYKAKLESLGLRASFHVPPRSVGGLESNDSDNRRTLNMRNFPTVPENTFMVELKDRQVQGKDQSSTSNLGSRVPDWVPIYPGTSPERISSHQAGPAEHYFDFQMTTHDDCHKVVDWYENKLHAAGYNTVKRISEDMPVCSDGLDSDGPGRTRSIKVDADENAAMGAVQIAIQAVERSLSGGAAATVPSWVPIYPGTTPQHMEARRVHDEYHLAFSFTTRDDPTKVYSWYKTKLESLGLRATFDVISALSGKGGLESNNSDNTRTFNMRNYPGEPGNTFTVELMDRPAQ